MPRLRKRKGGKGLDPSDKNRRPVNPLKYVLVDVSDFFLCSGRGKGESKAPGEGGGIVFIENPSGGGGGLQDGRGSRGREGVCSELGNFWGGGGG